MTMQPPFNSQKKSSLKCPEAGAGSRRSSNASVTFQDPVPVTVAEPVEDAPSELEVTERNTFLEVDSKGHKTLSIFRCYTSPVYRRLFSSATSSALGSADTREDLGLLEDNNPNPEMRTKKSHSGLGSVAEDETVEVAEEPEERPPAQDKTRKTRKSRREKRQYTADLEPFGKFEKYSLNPLNTGNRRSSMEAPAPLDVSHFQTSPRHLTAERRGSKDSDGFHSAVASPNVTITLNDGANVEPFTLNGNEQRAAPGAPAKIRVTEEHGGVPEDECTTIMVRNIPNKYSQRMLEEVFVTHGFADTFDFLYVPADFFHRLNLGYCFVNFKKPKYAQAFAKIFQDFHLPAFKSKKKIQISLANTQGFLPNVMKLEHTALCSQYVSPEFHPICVDPETGQIRPFLSFFPGYEPPPKSRVDDPEFWEAHDNEWEKQWKEDTLFPPVYVNQPTGQNKGGDRGERNQNKRESNAVSGHARSGKGKGGGHHGHHQGGHYQPPHGGHQQHGRHQRNSMGMHDLAVEMAHQQAAAVLHHQRAAAGRHHHMQHASHAPYWP